jgi:hypothetical protein
MEAGVTDRLWTVRDIAELLEQAEDKRATSKLKSECDI